MMVDRLVVGGENREIYGYDILQPSTFDEMVDEQ